MQGVFNPPGEPLMEYIIFLLSIQVPFLYLVWRFYQNHHQKSLRAMQSLKKQNQHIANFMDTLRMSVEKISEDIYGNGQVSSRILQIEENIKKMQKSFQQMELYTGLNTQDSLLKEISSSAPLKEKDIR